MLRKTMIVGLTFLMFSCSNDKKEEKSSGIGSVIDNVSNLNKIAGSANKIEELTNRLKKETRLTNEELKAAVPETLDGLKRTSFTAGNYGVADVSTINAEYGDSNKNIRVNIIDGAGESGSALVSLMALTLSMDTESESNGTVSKTAEVNGIRALTEDTKSESSISSSIKFLYKDRYSIDLEGNGYSLQELENYMKKLNIDALK